MNLHKLLQVRVAQGNPIRVGGSAQANSGRCICPKRRRRRASTSRHRGLEPRARVPASRGLEAEQFEASSFAQAIRSGTTFVSDDAMALIRQSIHRRRDRRHRFARRRASPMCWPVASTKAHRDGERGGRCIGRTVARAACGGSRIVYSLAYGDQPALICEMVDWARGRIRGHRGGQRHQISARIPRIDARYGLGSRIFRGARERRRFQRADVQFSSSMAPRAPLKWRPYNATGPIPATEGLKFRLRRG